MASLVKLILNSFKDVVKALCRTVLHRFSLTKNPARESSRRLGLHRLVLEAVDSRTRHLGFIASESGVDELRRVRPYVVCVIANKRLRLEPHAQENRSVGLDWF